MDFSKKFSFDILSLLKLCLFLVGTGCLLGIFSLTIAWIVVMASVFIVIVEVSGMYYSYQAKAKVKEKKKA